MCRRRSAKQRYKSMIGRISYDLIMEDDMSFVEGCYRLPYRDWEVFIISKNDRGEFGYKFTQWNSGVTGVFIQVPREIRIDAKRTEQMLSKILHVDRWVVVRGPDSIVLR